MKSVDQTLSRAEKRALRKQLRAQNRPSQIGKWVWRLALIGIISGVAIWIGTGIFAEKPGVKVPIQSREHIFPGSPHEPYNSNPPTSGPHHPQWSECGVFENDIPIETLVHNMEHGHVVILYKPDLEASEKQALREFTEKRLKKKNILMAPNKDIPSPIAMASWGWYQLFEKFDEEAFEAFYKAHRYRAPERIPCDVSSME